MTIENTTKIEIDTKEIGNYFTKTRTNVLVALQKEMTAQSRAMWRFVSIQYLRGGTTPNRLAVRSGHLMRTTIPIKTKIVGSMLEGGIQFGANYAKVHIGPEGQVTTIRPKASNKSGYLFIPVGKSLSRSGVFKGKYAKGGVRMVKQVKIKTRVHPKTIIQLFAPEVKRGFEEAIKTAIK